MNHIHKDIKEVILDGEMVAFDPSLGKVLPFGDLKTYAKASSFSALDPRPCFKVFDVLHIGTAQGSTSLLNTKLARRRQLLETKVFGPPGGVPNVLEIALAAKCFSVDCIQRFLGNVIRDRGEGIIVKNPASLYQLGGRTSAWIKVKPDYFDSLGECIECIVVGGYWGKGPRTSGRFSSFLAAVVDDAAPQVDGQPVCVTLTKVGSGLSLFAYNRIIENYGTRFFDVNPRNRPGWLRTGIEVPDQLILPTESFVLNVQAAEIIIGNDFGAGLTLRQVIPSTRCPFDDQSSADLRCGRLAGFPGRSGSRPTKTSTTCLRLTRSTTSVPTSSGARSARRSPRRSSARAACSTRRAPSRAPPLPHPRPRTSTRCRPCLTG